MFSRNDRMRRNLDRIEALSEALADVEGQLKARGAALDVLTQYEEAKTALVDTQIELAKREEDHQRAMREIEHKVGLTKMEMEQEARAARKEAELAVREESMGAQKEQFEAQMAFREERFKEEQAATRSLLEQILTRLPSYTHSTVRHEGVQPQVIVGELPSGEA